MPEETFDPTAISPRLLAQVLRRPVQSVDWERIGTERGFAGTVVRLVLHPASGTPATMIAKIGASEDPVDGVRREAAFYGDATLRAAAPAPRCWYAGASPKGSPVTLLEDLSDARSGDALVGASATDVALVLTSMTPLWRRGDVPKVGGLPYWGGDGSALRGHQDRYRAHWTVQRVWLHERLPHPVWRLGEELCDRLSGVLADLAASPRTVVHGDLHLDNVMFARAGAGEEPVVIDWATACRGPLALDVFSLLATSMSPGDHQQHADAMVDAVREDVDCRWGERLHDDGRRALLRYFAGVIGWMSSPGTAHPREAALRAAALDDGRLTHALMHWDGGRVLPR